MGTEGALSHSAAGNVLGPLYAELWELSPSALGMFSLYVTHPSGSVSHAVPVATVHLCARSPKQPQTVSQQVGHVLYRFDFTGNGT